jgi:hypothetical protein
MSIKSKVLAAAAMVTLVGAVVNAAVALFVAAIFAAATSAGRRVGPLPLSTGRRAGLPPLYPSPGRVPSGSSRRTVQPGWAG